MKTAYVEIRGQHSRGSSSNQFGGPDTYVAVQVVPEGVERLKALNRQVARNRGIEIIRVGEGYREHQGPRSMLGRAKKRAHKIAREYNEVRETFMQPEPILKGGYQMRH